MKVDVQWFETDCWSWRQAVYSTVVLYTKNLNPTVIPQIRRRCLLKISNTYLLLLSSFVTTHYLYLCSNAVYFDDMNWTKHIPWRLFQGWHFSWCSSGFDTTFGNQPQQHGQTKKLVSNAQNEQNTSTRPHPAISGYEIVSGSFFFLPFDCWHFRRSPPPVIHKFSCLCLVCKLLVCQRRDWWLFFCRCCNLKNFCRYALLLSHPRRIHPPPFLR